MQRISFLVTELDSVNQTARLRQKLLKLLEYVQEQDGGTPEKVPEAPGAYGGSHAAGAATYETASTLAPWPSLEMGVAAWHAAKSLPCGQTIFSLGRSAPGTGLQACCGLHGCLRQGLGVHVQRACSVGGLNPRHHPGLSGTGCALPIQVESSVFKKCGVLLGTGSWRLADRYL